jgi:hypothetical protein
MEHQGTRTEIMHVGVGMLRKYVETMAPDRLAVVWDGGRDKYRTELYPAYKRKGKEFSKQQMEERNIIFAQMRCLEFLFSIMGIEQYRLKGREADDVIFSIANRIDGEVVVVSTDKDMYQLLAISDKVKIYSPTKDFWVDREAFIKEYGFSYDQFVPYRALIGDASDNLPGVKGIGPVKAKALIASPMLSGGPVAALSEEEKEAFYIMEQLIVFIGISAAELIAGRCYRASEWNTERVTETLLLYGLSRHVDAMIDLTMLLSGYVKSGTLI